MSVIYDITLDTTQKFIIVSLSDGVTGLFGDPGVGYHIDIVTKLEQAGIKVLEVHGGGRLHVKSDEKSIFLWGGSTRYGDYDLDVATALLGEKFPDYRINNEKSDFEQ